MFFKIALPITDSNQMKILSQLFCVLCVAHFCVIQGWAGSADTNPPPRLTVELRDGSRVTGKSLDDTWHFHSAALGDLKLAVAGIRAVDMVGTNETARVTTAGGDVLDVQFLAPSLRVETGFGKTELPVKLIRSLKISAAGNLGQQPSSLDDLWSAEEDVKYSVEENLRSHGMRWFQTGGQITVGAFVKDIFEGRQGQPSGRGAIAKVVSVMTDNYGRQVATLNFGRDYSAGIFFSELSLVRVVPVSPPPKVSTAVVSTNEANFRLTVELRDGSRVTGESVEKSFKFRSALSGEIKLAVKDIRTVECGSTNSAKLTTTKGDSLTVAFVDSVVAVKTSFGKVELPVSSVRKISVAAGSTTGTHPPGLVALWSGEGDGKDSAGSNDLELTDISFADGQVSRAFVMNGFSSCMKLADSGNFNPGANGDGLTISVWIKPSNVTGFHPILEWNPIDKMPGQIGVQLWIGNVPGSHGVLAAHLVGQENESSAFASHSLISRPRTVTSGSFQLVTATYDKATGAGILYLNGAVVARGQWGRFNPLTTGDFWVSRRPTDHPGDWTYNAFFSGLMDEIAIYNRALSAEEIQSIYTVANPER